MWQVPLKKGILRTQVVDDLPKLELSVAQTCFF